MEMRYARLYEAADMNVMTDLGNRLKFFTALWLMALAFVVQGQISPGPLSEGHKHLEGISNCTQCHSLGSKVPDNKCLDCHKEISSLIQAKKGYHSHSSVSQKTCIDCHSEHHGRKFDLDKFDTQTFNHNYTGYVLKGKHKTLDCRECHKPELITSAPIRKLEGTYLGLGVECIDCHTDFHQGTLDNNCTQCHTSDAWKPVTLFDHNKAKFKLVGAHQQVECIECHKESTRNGAKFQEFKGVPFQKCTDCHTDPHKGSFGARCTDCHNESAWSSLNKNNRFDHNLTAFPLVGLHTTVDCKECHSSGKYTDPLRFGQCKNCHTDYHQGEFVSGHPESDCKDCHQVEQPFTYTLFGIDEHQESTFPLQGAHAATPCFACHISEDRWTFRNVGEDCIDCHEDIHSGFLDDQYYPNKSCDNCHNPSTWRSLTFDHSKTGWALEGKHSEIDCRQCHYTDSDHRDYKSQRFSFEPNECVQCHDNIHGNQFEKEGKTDCRSCHTIDTNWNIEAFDHSKSKFPLEGRHSEIECSACHKQRLFDDNVERIEYKIKAFECKDCHSS